MKIPKLKAEARQVRPFVSVLKKLSVRERKILFLCVIFIVFYAGYTGVIKPFKTRMTNLDTQIKQRESELRKDQALANKTKILDDRLRKYIVTFNQKESDAEVMSFVLKEIESVAAELNLRIVDLKPDKVKNKDDLNHFVLNLTIEGDYITIIQFLYTLQGETHCLNVDQLRFERGFRSKEESIIANITLSKALIPHEIIKSFQLEATKQGQTFVLWNNVPILAFIHYAEPIIARNIFQMPWEIHVESIIDMSTSSQLGEQIKLIGVYLDLDPKAIIEDIQTQEIHFVSKDESIKTAVLKELSENKAIFIYKGKKVELAL